MFKKLAVSGIGLVLFASPALAFAQSADVQSQIAGLLAQIKQLQALIVQLQNGSQSTSCVDLHGTLTLGINSPDVNNLQNYLIGKGHLDAQYKTGYYGFLTAQAVGKLQLELGLVSSASDTAYGIMGPKTRAAIACTVVPSQPIHCPVVSMAPCPTGQHYEYGETTYNAMNCPVRKATCVADSNSAPTCAYTSNSTGQKNGIAWNTDVAQTAESCLKKCTIVRNEKFGLADSGTCIFTGANGGQSIMSVPAGSTKSITVTAPNGGEQWEIGQLNTITWAPYGYNPNVNPASDVYVYLVKPEGGSDRILDTGKASLHTYFNIRDYSTWAAPGKYYVRVYNKVTGKEDTSDAPFTLLPRAVDIKVNGSDGPISLYNNQPITVTLKQGTDLESCTLSGVRKTPDGPYSFSVTSFPFEGYAFAPYPSASTAITLTCETGARAIRSDSVQVNQTTNTSASLKVISPNGGEQIDPSKEMNIKFSSTGLSSASVALYKNDTWKYWIKKDVQPSAKDLDWVNVLWTPSSELQGLGVSDNAGAIFKIYVTGQKADGTGYVDDKSDAAFGFTSDTTQPVVINSFTVSPTSVTSGQSVTFTWSSNLTQTNISYGGGCSIEGLANNIALYVTPGLAGASGSVTYAPTATATYTLRCSSGAKDGSPSASKQITVNVNSPQTNPVVISSFTASAGSVASGQPVTFSWNSNLTSNDISYYGGACNIEGLGNNTALYVSAAMTNRYRGASGSITYTPAFTATYTLRCYAGAKDGSPMATKQVTVSVQ